jgi:hypothetical protein
MILTFSRKYEKYLLIRVDDGIFGVGVPAPKLPKESSEVLLPATTSYY